MFAVLLIADFALHAVLRIEPGFDDSSGGARERVDGLNLPEHPPPHDSLTLAATFQSFQKNIPAALFSGTGKKSVAVAMNAPARAAGVERGMSAPQAVARCVKLVIRTPNSAAEAEARAALLAVGFTLSPSIEDTAPGVCTIDLKGLDPAQLPALARLAVDELQNNGLPATAGIAATPLLALYAARAAQENRSRSLARSHSSAPSASELSERTNRSKRTRTVDSDDDSVRPVTDAASFLAPLPLAAADPSAELASVLAGWGLRTLGELTALPRDEIVRRFGAEGLALWQRAAGGATRPLHLITPPQFFSATMEFEQEIETLEPLLFILRRFLDRLTLELLASQHVAAGLHLTLRLEDGTRHARDFRLPEPTADAGILFRTLHTHLESLQTAASILAVKLTLTPARPLVRQQGLFETGLRDPHGFAETLARVSALVGADRIGTPQLEDTHRPDAVKLIPPLAVIPPALSAPCLDSARDLEPIGRLHALLGLPLRRFRPPLAARIEFTEGRPTFLWTEQPCGEISFQSRAYPGSGEWWQNDRAWRRTEWDIALADGGLYRLVHAHGAYFVEGEYD